MIYISWINTPGSDLNVQCDDWGNYTALHGAIYNNRPSIVAQLLGDARIDSSLKHNLVRINITPLALAIFRMIRGTTSVNILKEHGALEA